MGGLMLKLACVLLAALALLLPYPALAEVTDVPLPRRSIVHPASHRVNHLVRPKHDLHKLAEQHRVRRDAALRAAEDLRMTRSLHPYREMPLLEALADETQITAHHAHAAHVSAAEELRQQEGARGGGGGGGAAGAGAGAGAGGTAGAGARLTVAELREKLKGLAARGHARERHGGLGAFAREAARHRGGRGGGDDQL